MKTKVIKKEVLEIELLENPITVLAKKYNVSYVTFYNLVKTYFPDFKIKRGRPKKIKLEKNS